MTNREKNYFLRRAEAELEMAQAGRHEAAVRAHYVLAGLYLDRVYGSDQTASSVVEQNYHAEAK